MERTEPTLVPEWLKNAGSLTGGGSKFHSSDNSASRVARNKPYMNGYGNDFGRSSNSDRTSSSYFRRSSSGNGYSHPKSYSSFGRNQRDKEWGKDISDSRDKGKLLNNRWHRDMSDPLTNTFSCKFERDGLRHSQSMISGKRSDTWPKTVVNNLNSARGDNNGLLVKSSPVGGVKTPSPGAEERAVVPEIGRIPPPGLSSSIQSLPIGTSAPIGGDKWTALAEVPVLVGSNETATLSASSSSTSVALGTATSLNMARAVAQGPSRAQTSSQLTVGTQRLEELAIKQSKQLIPVTPSMQKTLVVNPSDKLKTKVGWQHHPISSSLPVNHSPRMKVDISKASSAGNLHVLKPMREKNGVTPIPKDTLTPTSSSQAVSSTISAAPSFSGSAATRGQPNKSVHDRYPVLSVLEKRPTSQAQSRYDFFNLVRKKSNANSSSVADSAATAISTSVSDKLTETRDLFAPKTLPSSGTPLSAIGGEGHKSRERGEMTCNGDASDVQKYGSNGKKYPSPDPIFSEEEEAAFLRSMGWEENDDEGGLTEEEISTFHMDVAKYINSKTPLKILHGLQSKFLLPFESEIAGIDGVSSELSSADTS